MKTSNKSKIIAALGVLGSLAPHIGHAQFPGSPPPNAGWARGMQGTLRVADSSNLRGENVNDYIGKKIAGAQQQELGTVKDFLLEARSGRIAYIVAAAPNAGDQLRLLPANALQSSSPGAGFTTQMDQGAFHATPSLSQKDLEAGNIPANAASSGNRWGGQLIRASQLTGKLVSSGGHEAGAIDEVGIDLPNGIATLLFRTNPEFAGGAQTRFDLPLNRLEFGPGEQLTTRLTRADFAQVQGSNITPGDTQASSAATAPPPSTPQPTASVWPGSAMTPTGQSSAVSQDVTNKAAAIRAAIAADPNLVRENISVQAAGQTVMLRGRVSSEAVRTQIETLARAQAGGVALDNSIRVGVRR